MYPNEWIGQYYPVKASDPSLERLTDEVMKAWVLRLLNHALRKWQGLHKSTLDMYCITQDRVHLTSRFEDVELPRITASSCSLCRFFCIPDTELGEDEFMCPDCAIFKFRGGRRCDEATMDEHRSPYTVWTYWGRNEDMVDLLLATIKWVEALDDDLQ